MNFLILLIFFPLHAFSAGFLARNECPETDYSKRMGLVRNQTSSSWCRAFVAADLITFHQKSEPVSALDVAVTGLSSNLVDQRSGYAEPGDFSYFYQKMRIISSGVDRKIGRPILNRTSVFDYVAAYNIRERVCTEKEVPSQPPRAFMGSDSLFDPSNGEEISFLERELKKMGDVSRRAPSIQNQLMNLHLDLNSGCQLSSSPLEARLNFWEEFNQIALRNLHKNIEARCVSGPKPNPMKDENFYPHLSKKNHQNAAQIMAAWLRSGTPMEISYDSDFLDDERWKPAERPIVNHASVIAGMRWNEATDSCEFKIRNSWGPGCDAYASRFSGRCEAGNLWVTEDEVNQVTFALSRILP